MKITYGTPAPLHKPAVLFDSDGSAADKALMQRVYTAAQKAPCEIILQGNPQQSFGVALASPHIADFIIPLLGAAGLQDVGRQVQVIWNTHGQDLDPGRAAAIGQQRRAERAAHEQAITFMRERIGAARDVSRRNREDARANPHVAFLAEQADVRDRVIIPAYQGEIRKLELNPQLNSVDIINALRRMFNNETGAMNTDILRSQGKIEVDQIDQFRRNPALYIECNISRLAFA